ncbi:MAG: hypothetical protein ACLQJR_28050 [Stellaceae bacterium]
MRRTVLAALAALAIAAPAFGQGQVTPPAGLEDSVLPPPGGVSVSGKGGIVISSDLCARLRRAPAVAAAPSAEYRPGVDVNGDAVAPADLPSDASPPKLDNFPIVIGPNLLKRYGISGNSALFPGKAVVGRVTLRDGRAYFNGEPISDNEREMMRAACKEAKR